MSLRHRSWCCQVLPSDEQSHGFSNNVEADELCAMLALCAAIGVADAVRLFCTPPPSPSIVVRPPSVSPRLSTRERFQQHVADPACSGCHQLMNPFGFAFENYDAVGRYRAVGRETRIGSREQWQLALALRRRRRDSGPTGRRLGAEPLLRAPAAPARVPSQGPRPAPFVGKRLRSPAKGKSYADERRDRRGRARWGCCVRRRSGDPPQEIRHEDKPGTVRQFVRAVAGTPR